MGAAGQNRKSAIDGKIRFDQDNNRFVYNDGTSDRWYVGADLNGDLKSKMSQPGFDVFTCTDDQLIMSSDFNTFKIVETFASVSITGADYDTTIELLDVPEELRPSMFAFADVYDNLGGPPTANYDTGPVPYVNYVASPDGLGLTPLYALTYAVRDNLIEFRLNCDGYALGSGVSANIRVYIVKETSQPA